MSNRYVTAPSLPVVMEQVTDQIKHEMERRSYLVANELRTSATEVLRGQRHGRVYKVPGTYGKRMSKATKALMPEYGKKLRGGVLYRASAPGEPPAARTGLFRISWQPTAHVVFGSYISRIESDLKTENGKYTLGQILEEGTSRMAPRPYQDAILEKAKAPILRIYNQPYF